jgi:ribokinase
VSGVVVVGSVNVDLVVRAERLPAPGETVTGGTFERHGGGKSANQAVAAARLGARVSLVAAVGDDDLGVEALAELEREGVDIGGVARLAGAPTGVALIVVDAAGENQIAVASGANLELDGGRLERDLAGGSGDVVLLCLEVPDAAVLATARAAVAAGRRIVLNPAPARPLAPELLALGPQLTPNEAEARTLTGIADPSAAAVALARSTGAPAVVTVGAQGAVLAEPGHDPVLLPPPAVDVVDTTGAGDTLNGAYAAQLAAGAGVQDAARFAVAAAALSTCAAGARAGMPRHDQVQAALG